LLGKLSMENDKINPVNKKGIISIPVIRGSLKQSPRSKFHNTRGKGAVVDRYLDWL
jgi:hypothetical protein